MDHKHKNVPADVEESPHTPARPRTGPIVWGAVILIFCAYIAQRTLAPASIDTTTWAIASVVGLGLLLLVVGIAVIVRGGRQRP